MDTSMSESSRLMPPLPSGMTGDMRFVAWFYIIAGGLYSLTIIGAIFGVPVLISGLRLKEASEEFDAYQQSGMETSLARAFERQSRYFFIQKVFVIIALVLIACYILFFILVLAGIIGGFPWGKLSR